jgi:hypothetical protein
MAGLQGSRCAGRLPPRELRQEAQSLRVSWEGDKGFIFCKKKEMVGRSGFKGVAKNKEISHPAIILQATDHVHPTNTSPALF